jgi:glycosyltransferase involved in cell wall biosynthesis
MRVLHVDPERGWGGGERQVQLLLRELAQRGHEQTLAADPDGRLAQVLPAGVDFAPLRIRNHADVLAGVRLRTLARGHDVVHFHTARAHALAPLCPRSLWRVVTRRMDYVPRGGPYVRWLYNHAVDAVIAISDGVRRALLAGGVRAERIHVVASGIDPDALVAPVGARAACRSEWGVADHTLVAVVLGALERRKGQDVLLEAARAVPTMHVVFCGDGSERASLERAARRLGGRVTFAGFRQDVAACLAAADVVVLPSRHEGLGVAALEAMAAERPVVASRVGGLADVVVEGETGVLVPPDDVPRLAAALARLAADPGERVALGRAGRARVLAQFTAATMAEGTLACYERTS